MSNNESLKLFRYRSNSFHSVDSRLSNKVFFVCPLELNDPYEFSIKYDVDCVYHFIKSNKSVKSIVAEKLFKYSINLETCTIKGFKYRPKSLEECISLFDDDNRYSLTREWLNNLIKRKIVQFKESFGIISLSPVIDNPVMWSHYASDSHGFVEVYDGKLLIQNFISHLHHEYSHLSKEQKSVIGAFQVKYVDNLPNNNELVAKLICTSDDTNRYA